MRLQLQILCRLPTNSLLSRPPSLLISSSHFLLPVDRLLSLLLLPPPNLPSDGDLHRVLLVSFLGLATSPGGGLLHIQSPTFDLRDHDLPRHPQLLLTWSCRVRSSFSPFGLRCRRANLLHVRTAIRSRWTDTTKKRERVKKKKKKKKQHLLLCHFRPSAFFVVLLFFEALVYSSIFSSSYYILHCYHHPRQSCSGNNGAAAFSLPSRSAN